MDMSRKEGAEMGVNAGIQLELTLQNGHWVLMVTPPTVSIGLG